MILVLIALILVSSFVLVKAADITVGSISKLGKSTRAGSFFLSAFILALGTSLPELFIGITSSLAGTPTLSLGNVLGANITNIAFVAALGAIIFKKVQVDGDILRKDLGIALIAGIVPFLLILDGELSRVDGLILLSIYGVYASSLFKARYAEIAVERLESQEEIIAKILRKVTVVGRKSYLDFGRLFLGIALLLASGEVIVRIANSIAFELNIPVFLVGLIVLSFGTTLPELAFSIRSLTDRHPTMFFGNLLGSIIANSTLVIGLASLITPIRVVAFENYIVAFVVFVVCFLLFWLFTHSKRLLERWEALLLLAIYIAFIVVEFLLRR